MILDTLPTTRPDSQVPTTRGEGEVGGTELPVGDPTFELANLPPPDAGELGQSEGVRRDQFEHDNACFPQTTLTLQNLGSKELGKKRRESSKRNYYIISPRVIIKAIIIKRTHW